MNATTSAYGKAWRGLAGVLIALSMVTLSGCATLYFQQVQGRYQDLVEQARQCLGADVVARAFAAWDAAEAENRRRRDYNFDNGLTGEGRLEYLNSYQEALDAALAAGLAPEHEQLLGGLIGTRRSYLEAERWDQATAVMADIVDLSRQAEQASREAAAALSEAAAATAAAAGQVRVAMGTGAEASALLAGADPNVALRIGEAAPGFDLASVIERTDRRGVSGDEAEAAVRAALSALDGEQDPEALVAMNAVLAQAEAAAVAAALEVPSVNEDQARAGAARAIREVIAIGNPDSPKYLYTPSVTIQAGVQGALYTSGVRDDDRYGFAASRIGDTVMSTLLDAGVNLYNGTGIEPLAGIARLSLAAELAGTRAGADRSDAARASLPAVQGVLAEAGAQLGRIKDAARGAMASDYRARAYDTPLMIGMQTYVEQLGATGDPESARGSAWGAVSRRLDDMSASGATLEVENEELRREATRITDEVVRRLGEDPETAARVYGNVLSDLEERARRSVDEQQVLAYAVPAAARARQEASRAQVLDEPYLSGALAANAASRLQGAKAAAERAAGLWQQISDMDPGYLTRFSDSAGRRWEEVADRLTKPCPARRSTDPSGACQRAADDVVSFRLTRGGIIGAAVQRNEMLAEGYQVPLIPGFSLREDERETHRDAAAAIAIETASLRAGSRSALERSQTAAAVLPGIAASAQRYSREVSEGADRSVQRTLQILGNVCPETTVTAQAVTAADSGEGDGLPVRSDGVPLPERDPPGEIVDGPKDDDGAGDDDTRVTLLRAIPRGGADFFDFRNPLGAPAGGGTGAGTGGDSGTPAGPAPAPAPALGASPPPAASGPCTGTVRTFSATAFVTSDPGGAEAAVINLLATNPATLEFCFEGGTLRISGPSPFVTVAGTDGGGSFSGLSGSGTIGGNAANAVASGSFDGAAVFFGYTITLPGLGATVVYNYGGPEI